MQTWKYNNYETKTVRIFDLLLILYYGLHVLTYIAASQWRSQKFFFFYGDKVKVKLRKGSSRLEPQKICLKGDHLFKTKLRKGSSSLESTR